MTIQEIRPEFIPGAKIKVLGIGGCGNKAINRMISEGLEGVGFVAINTDAQDLAGNLADKKVNIGLNLTKGLGAGSNPEIGRKAAEESEGEMKAILQDTDMVFITCGMGGGTGTGAAPVIANIAKSMGILTVGIITKPFSFEGKKRELNAEEGIKKMKEAVDTLIVIPNDKIFTVIDKKTTFKQAFTMIDKILFLGVQGISDLIVRPGDINIDFADIKIVMQNSGNALLGIGYGAGEKRAVDAARKAIENPLLETNLDGAKSIIFAVAGGYDLTPTEVREAAAVVEEIIDSDVNMIWGMTFDESYEDEVKVTIIATGFAEQSTDAILKVPRRDILGRPTKEAENFITRGIKKDINITDPKAEDKVITIEEDLETPAFIRRSLNKEKK
ncbi:MAG: cell division protein FtsZ [candidate division SR1 bacterium CG_4_9_14_3_um_filter_40_9]|nr:MAG: cell division protein FtsZ [candidate division SR1 bacterium CG_4_9_14_3_um_filter_40_9]